MDQDDPGAGSPAPEVGPGGAEPSGPLPPGEASYVIDHEARVVAMDARAEVLLGWTTREARGRPAAELFVAPERRAATLAAWSAWTHRGPDSYLGQTIGATVRDAAGADLDVDVRLETERAGPEPLLRVHLRVVDATERFSQRTQLLGPAAMPGTDAIVRVDGEGVVRAVNPAAERLFRVPVSRLVGRPIGSTLPPEQARRVRRTLDRVCGGHVLAGALRDYDLADGTRIVVQVSADVETGPEHEVVGVTFVLRDVTDEVRRRQDLDQHLARLRSLPRVVPVGAAQDGFVQQRLEALLLRCRRHLHMEAVWFVRLVEGVPVLEASVGLEALDVEVPAGGRIVVDPRRSITHAMLQGHVPVVVPDVAAVPELAAAHADHPAMVAHVGAPVTRSDGTVLGAVGAGSSHEVRGLGAEHGRAMAALADVVGFVTETMERDLAASATRSQGSLVDALLAALDARDHYTAEHSSVVVRLAGELTEALAPEDCLRAEVELVARLHDIGKLGIPDDVLLKAGPLDAVETALMREHPAIGERIVAGVAHLAHLAPAIRAEHERWDGTGYPDRLAADAIPMASRIVLACDAWHAMRSDRPYRRALPPEAAVAELREGAGSQFDPDVVVALLSLVTPDDAPA